MNFEKFVHFFYWGCFKKSFLNELNECVGNYIGNEWAAMLGDMKTIESDMK